MRTPHTFQFPASLLKIVVLLAAILSSSCSRGNGLNGMYLRSRLWIASHSVENSAWYFTPNGEVFEKPTGGGTSFEAMKKTAPENCGTYKLDGDNIQIVWGGQRKPTVAKLQKKEGGFDFDGDLFAPVKPFENGQKLEGSYSGGAMIGAGTGSVVSSASSITFHKDGTYSSIAVGSVRSSGNGATVGGGSSAATEGTYELNGYTLTLKSKSGQSTAATAFPFGDDRIFVEGRLMKRQ